MNQDELDALIRPHGWCVSTSAVPDMWLISMAHTEEHLPLDTVADMCTLVGCTFHPELVHKDFFRISPPPQHKP